MMLSFLLTTIEKAFNKFLQLDPETNARLSPIVGKAIRIQFQPGDYSLYFLIEADYIRWLNAYDAPPDVTISGAPFELLALSRKNINSASLSASKINVTGDMETARQFKRVFAELDIDWEEQLSKFTGDFIAHQVGKFVQTVSRWAKQSADHLRQDVTEYAQQEARWLPLRLEVNDFLRQVDTLRNDVERLAARVQRLQQSKTDKL